MSSDLAAFSTRPDLVAFLGATPKVVRLLDQCRFFSHGVQSPCMFDALSVSNLMRKRSYSVFGRIDFFSVLQFLLISLGGCLVLELTLLTPDLVNVGSFLFDCRAHDHC